MYTIHVKLSVVLKQPNFPSILSRINSKVDAQ